MERLFNPPSAYEEDFMLWLEQQIAFLRSGKWEQLDIDNLTEELEGMVRSDHRELRSRFMVLIKHLLKCQFQPERKSKSWRSTLLTQRGEIQQILDDSPSLKRRLSEFASSRYSHAVQEAALETGLPMSTFPESNPYTVAQLLDPKFVP